MKALLKRRSSLVLFSGLCGVAFVRFFGVAAANRRRAFRKLVSLAFSDSLKRCRFSFVAMLAGLLEENRHYKALIVGSEVPHKLPDN